MKSPLHPTENLIQVEFLPNFTVWQCPISKGIYIPAASYARWQPKHHAHPPASAEQNPELQEEAPIVLCPETGTLMPRFRMNYDVPFYVHRSRTGGIWLDAGEWSALLQRKSHNELHFIFNAHWRNEVREPKKNDTQNVLLQERLGNELSQQLKQLKTALKGHPHRAYAVAFLNR